MAVKYLKVTAKIKVKTGLRIGGSKESVNIGGIDNIIIRNPADKMPYIPGSSLKGKMRFLMEWAEGMVDKKGDIHNCHDTDCPVCGLFGSTKFEGESAVPTRLIVRDAFLTDDYKDKDSDKLTEEKIENAINRLSGKAEHPRTMERVVPGVEFNFEAIIRLWEGDDRDKWEEAIKKAMFLLQSDYLGGSGSRGYGKIAFVSEDGREGYVNIDGKKCELKID